MVSVTDLQWNDEAGWGYLPVQDAPYDDSYFNKYVDYALTGRGRDLEKFRTQFVASMIPARTTVCDVGIGCGLFILTREENTNGYDIMPKAVRWLKLNKRFQNPYEQPSEALTFWDSFEHIHDRESIVKTAQKWIFISMPIYQDKEHCIRSKHFRPDEHCWYYTRDGLERWMHSQQFDLTAWSTGEQVIGREDIETFAFRRRCF